MLAVTTTDFLSVVDPVTLRKGPSSIPSCLDLLDAPIASEWAPDNSCLFITSAHTIHKYEPSSNTLHQIFKHETKISFMAVKSSISVIFSSGSQIHVLEGDHISQTFETHKGPVDSLSLCNDGTLLASASINAVHVYNLALGSHSVVRGLTNVEINAATFHPKFRTRLLVASGKKMMVFDATRPSGPIKSIQLNESATGEGIPMACSPFSDTLAAIATSTGFVSLIDLEKEKPLCTFNVKAALTTIAFSPEGAALYLGTQSGKILVVDLRGLDKRPKAVIVSETGSSVQTISIHKKVNVVHANTPAGTKQNITETLPPRRAASVKVTPSPARKPPALQSLVARRATSSTSPIKRTVGPKQVLSPVRDPQGNSAKPRGSPTSKPVLKNSPSPKKRTLSVGRTPMENDKPHRTRTLPSSTTSASTTSTNKAPTISTSASIAERMDTLRTSPRQRPRAVSSASRAGGKEPVSSTSASGSPRPPSSASRTSPVPLGLRAGSRATRDSSTPSPDLPPISAVLGPVTPGPIRNQQKKAMGALGLGTPEVDRWIRTGSENLHDARSKLTGKTVGFQNDNDNDDDEPGEIDAIAQERQRILSMQISPRRPTAPAASGSTEAWNASPALDLSGNGGASGLGTAGGPGPAHELLRTIVQDVMYDFQRETKADMMGLHLDLLRMGRGWRMELRTLMDEYVGDLKDLREENQRLRLENERLKRNAY